jgi:hypothetical protein
MGSSWPLLSDAVRAAHVTVSTVRASGRLRVVYGRSGAARVLARLLCVPRASDASDTRLVTTADGTGERWLRTFDARRMNTRQYQAGGGELAERIGVLELRFRLEAVGGSLLYRQVGAALVFGPVRVRVPGGWAPTVSAREDPAGVRRIRVDVRLALPAVGPVLAYDGVIDIEDPAS